MRWLFKTLIFGTALLLFMMAFLLLEYTPLVQTKPHEQVEHADKVSDLLDDARQVLHQQYKPQQVTVTELQAQSLMGFLQRAKAQLSGQVSLNNNLATLQLSYELPTWTFLRYVNVQAQLRSGKGVNLDTISVGDISLPGAWVMSALEYAANTYTQSEVASIALQQVDNIEVQTRQMQVNLLPLDPLLRELKNIKTGSSSKRKHLLKIKMAHYLRLLDGMYIPPVKGNQRSPSLSYYLQGLMAEAKALSDNDDASATLENEAAIMALAVYAGHRRFSAFVGDLSFAIDKVPYARPKPSLANRGDLSLHFIFSAAIKLLSEQGISIAVGEFKELMDRRKGGSGYSFVDLAADMAGAQFAALAVAPETAKHVQDTMARHAKESLFFPDISDLEEGMSKADFAQKYQAVDSPAYQNVVAQINMRLAHLPIQKGL